MTEAREETGAGLQEALDALAGRLGVGITIDGPDGQLLAYSSQPDSGATDEARLAAILRRHVEPEVRAWEEAALREADPRHRAVRVPANPQLGMAARVCVPLRRRGRPVGSLWVIDDGLDETGLAALNRDAPRIAALLSRSPAAPTPAPAAWNRDRLVRAAYEEGSAQARDDLLHAVPTLLDGPVQVLAAVATGAGHTGAGAGRGTEAGAAVATAAGSAGAGAGGGTSAAAGAGAAGAGARSARSAAQPGGARPWTAAEYTALAACVGPVLRAHPTFVGTHVAPTHLLVVARRPSSAAGDEQFARLVADLELVVGRVARDVRIGLADPAPFAESAAVARRQALFAAETAALDPAVASPAPFARLGVHRLLARADPPPGTLARQPRPDRHARLGPVDPLGSVDSLEPPGSPGSPGSLDPLDVLDPLGPLDPTAPIAALEAAGESGAMLLATLEAYLDAAGDVQAVAARLGLHRSSLYYRLDRATDLLSADLSHGPTRLALHLACKARRVRRRTLT